MNQQTTTLDATLVAVLDHLVQVDPGFEIFHRLEFHQDEIGISESLSLRQLSERSRSLASVLVNKTKPGDRIAILLPTGLEYPIALMACFYAGLVAVPLYPPRRNRIDRRIEKIISDCQPAVVLGSSKVYGQMQKCNKHLLQYDWIDPAGSWQVQPRALVEDEVSPDQLALLQYTSGSTGSPKGIMLTQRNIISNSKVIREGLGYQEQSRKITWLPFFHDMGLVGDIFQAIYSKCTHYLMSPAEFSQSPFRWLKGISQFGITHSGGPNFAYSRCLQISRERIRNLDLSTWECAYTGAEIIRAKDLEAFTAKFHYLGFRSSSFHPCYGMAEATLMLTGKVPGTQWKKKSFVDVEICDGISGVQWSSQSESVSCGQAWNGHSIEIVDPENKVVLPSDTLGEVWCRGESIGSGYWQRPEKTAEVFDHALRGIGGYLRTGDLGIKSAGKLYILGRLKDLIILDGENYYPDDLEAICAAAHPGLSSAGAAFAWVTEDSQEKLVILHEVTRAAVKDQSLPVLLSKIRAALINHFIIQAEVIVLVRPLSLPRTSSGKIQRFKCREYFLKNQLAELGRWQGNQTLVMT